MSFLALRDLAVCMETKVFFFENQVFLIPDFYFYDIKIQTNLSLNDVEKSMGKSQFSKIYIIKKHKKTKREKKMKWTGLYWPNYKAGLSPPAWAGLMFQPETKRGWT